jgi:hypothetical protein
MLHGGDQEVKRPVFMRASEACVPLDAKMVDLSRVGAGIYGASIDRGARLKPASSGLVRWQRRTNLGSAWHAYFPRCSAY